MQIRILLLALTLPSAALAQTVTTETSATAIGTGVSRARASATSSPTITNAPAASSSSLTVNSTSSQPAATDSTARVTSDGTLATTATVANSNIGRQKLTGTQRVISAPSVVAPGLSAAGLETCLGSASGGVSFPGGGAMFGTTTTDTGCDARLDARTLWAFGLKQEAMWRLCQKPEIAAAMPGQCGVTPAAVAGAAVAQAVYTAPAYAAPVQAGAAPGGCVHYELLAGCLDGRR